MSFFALLGIALLVGIALGGLVAFLRKGTLFDIGHYALVFGVIFLVLAAFTLTILSRV